jgi:hypothetical protein
MCPSSNDILDAVDDMLSMVRITSNSIKFPPNFERASSLV